VNESDVIQWLLDECETVLTQSNYVSLSTPVNHVDVAEPSMDHPYPFVGIQPIATNQTSAGIGNGNLFVDSLNYGSDGILDSITYRRESTLRVETIPVTDDDPKLRDDLGTELTDYFNLYTRTRGQPSDMDPPQIDESTPQGRSDDFIDSDGIAMEITYEHFITDTDPDVAESVNVELQVGDEVGDIVDWGDEDWGDEDWATDDPIAHDETILP